MAESPVKLERVDCGNGKKKMIVREREYDMRSWHGMKTMVSMVVAVIGVIVAVLTAYYTAEASQNSQISAQSQNTAIHQQRLDDHEKNLGQTLRKFDATLTEQRKVMYDTKDAVIRIDTRQQVLIERVEKISDKLDAR